MQRRKIHGVMAHDSFVPRAFLDNKAMVFSKDMEGLDTSPNLVETGDASGAAQSSGLMRCQDAVGRGFAGRATVGRLSMSVASAL
jgi:hypothetical protein